MSHHRSGEMFLGGIFFVLLGDLIRSLIKEKAKPKRQPQRMKVYLTMGDKTWLV